MPDISMCQETRCPSKDDCYRFTATPYKNQSYADFWNPLLDKERCDFFMPNKKTLTKNKAGRKPSKNKKVVLPNFTEAHRNRNTRNPFQGSYKRVLFVCNSGLLRSATLAFVMSKPPHNFNTRAAGVEGYALIKVDEALLRWSQEIVCAEDCQSKEIKIMLEKYGLKRPVLTLGIIDKYDYRDKSLTRIAKRLYEKSISKLKGEQQCETSSELTATSPRSIITIISRTDSTK